MPKDSLLASLVKVHKKHYPVSTDGERAWYPTMACRFLKLKHYIYSFIGKEEKSPGDKKKKMQYIKDRTESFDDYFPYRVKNFKLNRVINWLNLFVCKHNNDIIAWLEPSFVFF
ncbi:MAG TPA: hypothetical protein VFG45_04240 [Candidatus Nitrosocosmicus sp.]|nr:hypothetical protein [Candidatus Nitrosocosmicus sp.]